MNFYVKGVVEEGSDVAGVLIVLHEARRAILEKDNAQVDPTTLSGKTDTSG